MNWKGSFNDEIIYYGSAQYYLSINKIQSTILLTVDYVPLRI